jgi:hypothetical protein
MKEDNINSKGSSPKIKAKSEESRKNRTQLITTQRNYREGKRIHISIETETMLNGLD